jgi:peptide/nickel transport system substrate-binding protein
MKRLFVLAALLAAVLTAAYGSGQQGGGSETGSTQGGSIKELRSQEMGAADVGDTTSDIDVSKLTLKGAPGLPGNVKDRLPAIPKLVNEIPKDLLKYEIGKYGGAIRFATTDYDWDADVFIMCNEPLLNSPGILGQEITGNILRGYTVSPDQKEFTFYLREGLKWSDGVPVTMEDFRFAIEDVVFNTDLTPVLDSMFKAGSTRDGAPMKFQIVDDWTFKISFDQPYGGFLVTLAIRGWAGYTDILKPAHYLKPYHIKYATPADKARWPALYREYGYDERDPLAWANLFNKIDIGNWDLCQKVGIGFPKLYPWILTSANDTVYTYERNPYYFKIDEAGNQLPYVDKLESYKVENFEMAQLKVLAGEVDFSGGIATADNLPLFRENEKNGFTTYMALNHTSPANIGLNLTWAGGNEEYLSIVRNLKFRQAMNKAIDREELIDTVYYGFAGGSTFADPAFDPAGAEKLLQEIGMRKGPDGFYRTPSGRNFEILFETANSGEVFRVTELVVEMWKAVGINTTLKRIEGSLYSTKRAANQLQAEVYFVHTHVWYYMDWGMFMWGRAWQVYFTNTTMIDVTNPDGTVTRQAVQGETPPRGVLEFQALVDKLMSGSLSEANAAYANIKENVRENLWLIVPVDNFRKPLIINSKLRNIAEGGFGIGVTYSGEIFWYDS